MHREQLNFQFLNVGHFLDHYFMLIFATAAALRLTTEWGLSYAELIPYATPGFIAFGICAIPAGILADKWSRHGMMLVFFVGIGASSILAGLARNPLQIGLSLTMIGVFAAIYHPVGIAMVVQGRTKTGIPLAINGIWGNMGVASAALLTGFLVDTAGWRSAFFISGIVSICVGLAYSCFLRTNRQVLLKAQRTYQISPQTQGVDIAEHTLTKHTLTKHALIRVFGIIFFTTALGGLIFQSTTFALPGVLAERLAGVADTATMIGWYAFIVFAVASFAQLVVGYLVDQYPVRKVFATVALLQAVFLYLMMQLSGLAALIVATVFMLAVFGQIPINDVLIGRLVSSGWRSRAYAARYVVTFSVMATTVPLIAWLQGTWGFSILFGVLSAAASLIFIAALLLPQFQTTEQI